ncbi:MAG: LamG domain-containing protein [Phycisphaerales bacterium]
MKKVLLSLLVLVLAVTMAKADLRAWYAFDESSGDYAFDSSSYGNTGLLVAETEAGDPPVAFGFTSTQPQRIAGVNGNALLFNSPALNNYNTVRVTKSDSIRYMGDGFTFAFWLRQDSRAVTAGNGGGYPRVISCPNYEVELGVPGWEYDYIWPYDNGGFQVDVGPTYLSLGGSLGDWYHMAITFDGQYLKKYLNGQLAFSADFTGQNLIDIWQYGWDQAPLTIGGQVWPNKDFFIGAMDDVAIWGNAYLDADAVAGLFAQTLTPATAPFTEIPEPTTMLLISLGGLLLRKRK